MLDFENFKYNKSLIPEDVAKKEQFFKDLQQSFIEEISHSAKAKSWFEKVNASNVDKFIEDYAKTKTSIIRYYQGYDYQYRQVEEYEYGFQQQAGKALNQILQKKLFNMQLLWRANKLKIEGIDISHEFGYWENHITSCPFIAPIEEHEKDIMKEYLLSLEDEEFDDHWFAWQDYDDLMEKDNDGLPENMPDWYEFYDSRMGTGGLLILPDLKGAKEDFYVKLAYKKEHSATAPVTPAAIDNKRWLHGFWGMDVIEFSRIYETDKHIIQLFKGYKANYDEKNRDVSPDSLQEAIDKLLLADRRVYFPSHLNWDEAIIRAATKYTNTKIAEAIDAAYDEYKMRLELGISESKQDDRYGIDEVNTEITQHLKTGILKGRVINGEPADFDY